MLCAIGRVCQRNNSTSDKAHPFAFKRGMKAAQFGGGFVHHTRHLSVIDTMIKRISEPQGFGVRAHATTA